MSSVTSPSPTLPPEVSNISTSSHWKNGIWRPLISCGGALGLGLALAQVLVKPVALHSESGEAPHIYLPSESTMIVRSEPPPGALLRGQIRLVADVLGRAPVGGAVARQLVEPGTRVKRGDVIVEISSGQAQRPAPRAESLQSQAEQSQIRAADSQNALAQKVSIAQSDLISAQKRVERAQAQVSAARDIVRRLQNGESVAASEIPSSFRAEPDKSEDAQPRKRSRKRNSGGADVASTNQTRNEASLAANAVTSGVTSRAAEIASQQAQAARDAAREGNRALQMERQTLTIAQNNVAEVEAKLKAATTAVSETEARFEAKKASGADVEAARSAQREAQTAVLAAAKALAGAKTEVLKREKSAASLQQYADKAQAEAVQLGAPQDKPKSSAPIRVAQPIPTAEAAAETTEKTTSETASATPGRVTLKQAAQYTKSALDESRNASREAEKVHADIESYQRQVASSRSQIEAATQNLASAQQGVLDSVPRPRFTTAAAPADGVVTWISRLAREVASGQSVFGIARGGKVGVRFEDKSGLWRNVKVGSALPALIVMGIPQGTPDLPKSEKALTSAVSATPTTTAEATPTTQSTASLTAFPSASNPTTVAPMGSPVTIQVTDIENPANAGESAVVSGNVSLSASVLQAGMEVMVSVPQPDAKPTISVPVSALMEMGEAHYLAILTEAAPKTDITTPSDAPKLAHEAGDFHLQWQRVQVGRSDGIRQEIIAGLQPGERVVLSPAQLEVMGLEPQIEPSDGKMDSVSPAPGNLTSEDVLVRLTSS